ncbi:MAG: hypothetical protein WDW38_010272 [Sanguina aurantia]
MTVLSAPAVPSWEAPCPCVPHPRGAVVHPAPDSLPPPPPPQADIDLHDIPQPGAIAWWRSLRLGRVLLYHLPNFLPVAYMHTFIAEVRRRGRGGGSGGEGGGRGTGTGGGDIFTSASFPSVNIVSWLCPPGQDILRVIDYVVSSLSAVEHVELRVSADLSWAPILERLGELRGLRSLQLSPCFSRMNDDVELPSGQHLAAICARMKVCRPPARPGSVRSTGPPGLPGALGSLARVDERLLV